MCDALLSMKMSCFAFSSLSFPFCIILPVILHKTGTFFFNYIKFVIEVNQILINCRFWL